MKKIIIFNASSFLYGAEKGLLNLIKALNKYFDITVVLPKRGILGEKIKRLHSSVKIMIFPLARLSFSYSPFYYLKFCVLFFVDFFFFLLYITKNKFDIVATNSLLLLFPALCAKISGKPHIWFVREVFDFQFINDLLGRYVNFFSKKVICQSNFIKKKLNQKKAEVIYEALDPRDYNVYESRKAKSFLKLPLEKTVISIISRIHPSKGQHEFIKNMYDILLEENIILLIAGDISLFNLRSIIYKKKMERFIRRHNLKNVILLGFIEDVSLVYSASDICVSPFLRKEPFGICIAEALSFGKVTLYPFKGGLKEIRNIFVEGFEFSRDKFIAKLKEKKYKQRLELKIPPQLSFKNYFSQIMRVYSEL
jgi:glycosyltransferase involved in cell wall biosynthesis